MLVCGVGHGNGAASRPPAAAAPDAQPDTDRVRVRRGPVERAARGRCRAPPDHGTRRRDQPGVLAGRQSDRLHRRVRRQRRRLRRAGRRRRAEAPHVASRRPTRCSAGRRTARASSSRSTRTAYSRFAELFTIGLDGGLPERLPLPMGAEGAFSAGRHAASPTCRSQRAFTTWKRYRGGQDDAHLDRHARRLPHREGPARQLERLQPDVGRRHGLLPVGSRRARHAVLVRHAREEGRARCSTTTAST